MMGLSTLKSEMPEVAAARAVLVKCRDLVVATIKPTMAEVKATSELHVQGQAGNVSTITYVVCCMQFRDPYDK